VAQRGPRILMVSQRANRHYGRPRWCAGGRDRGIGVSRDEREKERERERERSSQEMVEVEEQHSNQYRASRAKPSLDYSVCRSLALNLSLSLSLSLSRTAADISLPFSIGHHRNSFSLLPSVYLSRIGAQIQRLHERATAPLTGTSPRVRQIHTQMHMHIRAPIRERAYATRRPGVMLAYIRRIGCNYSGDARNA